MDKIKVLIADDHTVVREGFRKLLNDEPGIEVIGEAKDGQEAVAKTKEGQPDVVLMDITMPGMDGFEATRLIKRQHPDVNVLILTVHESDEFFFNALSAGASGYFIKGASSRELASAIEVVAGGGTYLHPTVAKKLVNYYLQGVKSGSNRESYSELTDREKSILTLLAESRSNHEIAEILQLSANTVQTHRARLMMKLGLHNRTDLVKYAIKRGFVNIDK